MDAKGYITHVKCQCDCYEQTIQILICFDSAVRFDNGQRAYLPRSHFLPGRRLHIDPKKPSQFVTPDAVCQLSDSYGIVGEIKFSASTDQDFRKAQTQLEKYDNDLHGWKTASETIKVHDLSLLVNDLQRNRAKDFFKDKKFTRKLTLVACARQGQVSEVIKIEKYEGAFSDDRLEKKMYHPIAVPIERLIAQISATKFYDAEPPVEYTMHVLWMSVFNELANNDLKKTKKEGITVDLGETVQILKTRFAFPQLDKMQPESPRTEWVRKALNSFITIGYATRKSSDKFIVRYEPYARHVSMIEVFAKKLFDANKKRPNQDDRQLEIIGIVADK